MKSRPKLSSRSAQIMPVRLGQRDITLEAWIIHSRSPALIVLGEVLRLRSG
jgi:hypothetical protein